MRGKNSWLLLGAAVLILGMALLIRLTGRAGGPEGLRLQSVPEMRAYLSRLGWETEEAPVSVQEVTLPEEFSAVLENYNRLQRQQGFDLLRHAGKSVVIYTFRVLNYPRASEIYCTLYLRNDRLIAGDIHAASLNGFMTGLDGAPDPAAMENG